MTQTLTPMQVLEDHPFNDQLKLIKTGDQLWIAEHIDGYYHFITGYWSNSDNGLAQARATLCQLEFNY